MDLSLLRSRVGEFKNLLAAIPNFKKDGANSNTNPEILKLARGIALLLIAILLGWIGKSETENRTRLEILQNEWPSATIWRATLLQGGWIQITSGDLSSILKNHPDPFSTTATLWETEDHCWIFLTQSPYQKDHSEPELWSCATGHNKPGKLKWHKIGSGYSSLNQLSQIVIPKVKKVASYIDPKEIRY